METTKQRISCTKKASFDAILVGVLLLSVFVWNSWATAQQSEFDMVSDSMPMMGAGMMGSDMAQMHGYMQNNMEQMMQHMRNFMGMNMVIDNHNHE